MGTEMSRKPHDIIGVKFGSLLAVSRTESIRRKGRLLTMWNCLCNCGRTIVVDTSHLLSGHTKSCGCTRTTKNKLRATHGMSHSPTWKSWASMKNRCYQKSEISYKWYGARGIWICDGWRSSFRAFLLDMGNRPSLSHSIERIDGKIGYTCGHCAACVKNKWPANCKWATDTEQANNRRTNHSLTLGDTTMTIAQWSRRTGIGQRTIYQRLKRGWTPEKALTAPTPAMKKNGATFICVTTPDLHS
jgi:hypothetical protein